MKKRKNQNTVAPLVVGAIFCCVCCAPALVRVDVCGAQEEVRMAGYTTYYNREEGGRSENIALAAAFIDGILLQPYGEFSFNQTVGERSEERGFQQAKVIVGGEYVPGVGGGVCQVSTTLYNAALYAGLTVTEVHAHSLTVGYVPPSQDAMVSSACDFRLFNPYDFTVRLEMKTGDGALKARVYGRETGERREIVSRVVSRTPPPPPLVVDGETDGTLREGREGTVSESYLEIYQNGIMTDRKLLRKDQYAPTRGIIAKKIPLST